MAYNFKLDNYKIEQGEALLGKGDILVIEPLAGNQWRVQVAVRKPKGCSWEVAVPLSGTTIEVKALPACGVSFGMILRLDDATHPNQVIGQITLSPSALYKGQQPQDVGTFTGTKG